MKRTYKLSNELEKTIHHILKKLSTDLNDAKYLAECVLRLSDFFIQNPELATPWNEKWCQVAYTAYYYPLNWLRSKAVTEEAIKFDFFKNIETIYDFGAGMGSGSAHLNFAKKKILIEKSAVPSRLLETTENYTQSMPIKLKPNSLSIFSYSITELEQIPDWIDETQSLMIIEPATQQDGRKLLTLRQDLIQRGFYIWAPCLHQDECPMLLHSKKDWCHDRIHFDQPEWFQKLEKLLPMRNQTLTMSYLLASRQQPIKKVGKIRLTGDPLIEKGKTKIMACRNSEREFLSWLDRNQFSIDWQRGELIDFPSSFELKGQEIRIKKD